MTTSPSATGGRRPISQYQKGQSGNPSGRPKKMPDFLEVAEAIFNVPVTGQANGKGITLPVTQAVFRRLCLNALKGDNAALRRIVDLMLTLGPEAHQQAEQEAKSGGDAKRKLRQMAGLDPDVIYDRPKTPDPRMEELKMQADAMAKEERKRLLREAKRRQQMR